MTFPLETKDWHHAPPHRFYDSHTFIVTGATSEKRLLFKTEEELDLLHDLLLELADHYQWKLQAWAVFPNHYHFVGYTADHPSSLQKFVQHLHANSARKLNSHHGSPKRKVWHQYWETALTYQNSYFTRLKYVMENPVKHGIVSCAQDYKWCSARWFDQQAPKSFSATISTLNTDTIHILDDF